MERMCLSGLALGGRRKRGNLFLKKEKSVKFFNTNTYSKLKSKWGILLVFILKREIFTYMKSSSVILRRGRENGKKRIDL